MIDYYINGVKTQKPVYYVLRDVFHKCVHKLTSVQIALFPSSARYRIFPYDRENYKNTVILRKLFREVISRRRLEPMD